MYMEDTRALKEKVYNIIHENNNKIFDLLNEVPLNHTEILKLRMQNLQARLLFITEKFGDVREQQVVEKMINDLTAVMVGIDKNLIVAKVEETKKLEDVFGNEKQGDYDKI